MSSAPIAAPNYLAPGTLLKSRYELEEEIGRGGYSVVYRARDRELGSTVAIKLLMPPPADAHIARERMRREVQAVRGISHPNIVAVHDFLEDGALSFIVMEYIDGPDLARHVREAGPMGAAKALEVGKHIADALGEAHARGILHRDVKPQNVLLDREGRARLTDFGSARLAGQSSVTRTGGLVGTIQYAAPELLDGERGDARSDVYAFGLTLYYVLTCQLPSGASHHLPPEPTPGGFHPALVRRDVPSWLDHIIASATAETPGDRYATATALSDAFARRNGHVQADGAEEPPARVACIICGEPEPLGLPVCPSCGGTDSDAANTLIFIKPPISSIKRKELAERIAQLLKGRGGREEIALAAAGSRALVRVPADGAESVISELGARDVPARAKKAERAWAPLPGRFLALTSLIAGVGLLAGLIALPKMTLISALFAGLLVLLAQRHLRTPIVEVAERRVTLPDEVETKMIATVAALRPGAARDLLADIARLSHVIYEALPSTSPIADVGAELDRLLIWSCDAASDLAAMDETLETLDATRERSPQLSEDWLESMARTERVRARLVQRLLEVTAIMGRMSGYSGEILAAASTELRDAARDVERHLEANAEAIREVEALLGSSG